MSKRIKYESGNEVKVYISDHAVERFIERHPDLVKRFSFMKTWKDKDVVGTNWNKTKNKMLLFELFKRGEEIKTIYNDFALLLNQSEKHKVDVDKLMFQNNGQIIFICEKKRDSIIIKTILDRDSNIGSFVPEKQLKLNVDVVKQKNLRLTGYDEKQLLKVWKDLYDNDNDYELITPSIKRKVLSMNQLVEKQNLISMSDDYEKDELLSKPTVNEEKMNIQQVLTQDINSRLAHLGIELVGINNKQDYLVYFSENFCKTHPNLNNTLGKIRLSQLKGLLNKEYGKKMLITDYRPAEHKDYVCLLSELYKPLNTGLIGKSDLKEILKLTLPDDLKSHLNLNNKLISNVKLESVFLSDYHNMVISKFMNLDIQDKNCLQNILHINRDKSKFAYFLSRNILTNELMFTKFKKKNENKSYGKSNLFEFTLEMSMVEHFECLNQFINMFDSMTDKQKESIAKGIQVDNSIWQEVFQFAQQEIKKYTQYKEIIENAQTLSQKLNQIKDYKISDERITIETDNQIINIIPKGNIAIHKSTQRKKP